MKRIASAYLLILLFLTVLISCAKIEFPSGGPADTEPPTILESSPALNQRNVPLDSEIRISFSEKMTKNDAATALIIVPEPEEFPKLSWKKNDLVIRFDGDMEPDKTYLLTLKTGMRDLRKNPIERPFRLAFSTGEYLDTGMISGMVYQDNKSAGDIDVWAFPYEENFDIIDKKPLYLTQSTDSGAYRLEYLADGNYLCFAVRDKSANRKFDPSEDLIGLPVNMVRIDSSYTHFPDLDFLLLRQDTACLKLLSAEFTPDLSIVARFSEALDISTVSVADFKVTGGDTGTIVEIGDIFAFSDSASSVMLICQKVPPVGEYLLEASDIFSMSGKPLNEDYDTASSALEIQADTVGPRLAFSSPSEGQQDFPVEGMFVFRFSEYIGIDSAQEDIFHLTAEDSSLHKDFKISFDKNVLFIKSDSALLPGKSYNLSLNKSAIIDISGNNRFGDSIYSYSFKTADTAVYGAISGELKITAGHAAPKIFLKSPISKIDIPLVVDSSGHFYMELPSGKYNLWGYDDINGNGRYDRGTIRPFEFAEPYRVFPDTVSVRSRFETEGILLEMK